MSPVGDDRAPERLQMERAIDALRARGAQHVDPVRLRHIEALVRRADSRHGETHRLLSARVEQLLDATSRAIEQSRPAPAVATQRPPQAAALSELLAHIARHAVEAGATASGHPSGEQPPAGLKALRYFGSTWSRLSLDLRMAEAFENVPQGAGPINTQRLLHQALSAMRDASPEYLLRFMSQVEALLALAQVAPTASVPRKGPARGARGKRPASPGVE